MLEATEAEGGGIPWLVLEAAEAKGEGVPWLVLEAAEAEEESNPWLMLEASKAEGRVVSSSAVIFFLSLENVQDGTVFSNANNVESW